MKRTLNFQRLFIWVNSKCNKYIQAIFIIFLEQRLLQIVSPVNLEKLFFLIKLDFPAFFYDLSSPQVLSITAESEKNYVV